MQIASKLLGPESKYDRSLPYTYEARVPIIEGESEYNSYFADTICGLVDYLEQHGITPDQVRIYEIYQDAEKLIDLGLCTSEDRQWLHRPALCEAFKEYYQGHIFEGGCSFSDRDKCVCGP